MSAWEDRSAEHKRYVEFFRKRGHRDPTVSYHNTYAYLTSSALHVLGEATISELAEAEANDDDNAFMRILAANKPKLDISTGNFLYHRWIRMLTIKRYTTEQQHQIQSIPIAFLPFYPLLDAFIVPTPEGNIICFSEGLNGVLLSVFMTMARSIRFQQLTTKKPQLSSNAAEDRIIALAKFLVGGCKKGTDPPALELEDRIVLAADLLNNATQSFILAHEYNHFLLGHLRDVHAGAGPISRGTFEQLESFTRCVEHEVAADELAVTRIKESNQTPNGIQFNAMLCTGVHALLLFAMICKKLLGFSESALAEEKERMAKVTESIFHDAGRVFLLEEVSILHGALDKVR